MWRNVKLIHMWRNFRFLTSVMYTNLKFLHMSEFFSTDTVRVSGDKYEVWFLAAQVITTTPSNVWSALERRKGKSTGEFLSCFVCYCLSEAAAFHLICQYFSATLIKVLWIYEIDLKWDCCVECIETLCWNIVLKHCVETLCWNIVLKVKMGTVSQPQTQPPGFFSYNCTLNLSRNKFYTHVFMNQLITIGWPYWWKLWKW